MDSDGGTNVRLVAYQVTNPEWERLSSLLAGARIPADALAQTLDATYRDFAGAICSPRGDELGAELDGWRQAARRASEAAIQELEGAVASVPKTVTHYYWQHVPDSDW